MGSLSGIASEMLGGLQVVQATVPLSEVLRYATDLSDLPTADEIGAEFEAFLKDVTDDDQQS